MNTAISPGESALKPDQSLPDEQTLTRLANEFFSALPSTSPGAVPTAIPGSFATAPHPPGVVPQPFTLGGGHAGPSVPGGTIAVPHIPASVPNSPPAAQSSAVAVPISSPSLPSSPATLAPSVPRLSAALPGEAELAALLAAGRGVKDEPNAPGSPGSQASSFYFLDAPEIPRGGR
jgi:cysteine desulfurase / selenocysteine lyase